MDSGRTNRTQLSLIKDGSTLRRTLLRFHPYFICVLSPNQLHGRLEAAYMICEPQLRCDLGSRPRFCFVSGALSPMGAGRWKFELEKVWQSVLPLGDAYKTESSLISSPRDPGDQGFCFGERFSYFCLWCLSRKWCFYKTEWGDCSFKFWIYNIHELGSRKVAHWIKCLPCKREDQDSSSQHAWKSQADGMHACNPSTLETEKGREGSSGSPAC